MQSEEQSCECPDIDGMVHHRSDCLHFQPPPEGYLEQEEQLRLLQQSLDLIQDKGGWRTRDP